MTQSLYIEPGEEPEHVSSSSIVSDPAVERFVYSFSQGSPGRPVDQERNLALLAV
jgi:hypothetical protein